jgi:hypothetical protein
MPLEQTQYRRLRGAQNLSSESARQFSPLDISIKLCYLQLAPDRRILESLLYLTTKTRMLTSRSNAERMVHLK